MTLTDALLKQAMSLRDARNALHVSRAHNELESRRLASAFNVVVDAVHTSLVCVQSVRCAHGAERPAAYTALQQVGNRQDTLLSLRTAELGTAHVPQEPQQQVIMQSSPLTRLQRRVLLETRTNQTPGPLSWPEMS